MNQALRSVRDAIRQQPVAFLTICSMAINLGVSFGLNLNVTQISELNIFLAAVVGFVIHENVSPVAFTEERRKE